MHGRLFSHQLFRRWCAHCGAVGILALSLLLGAFSTSAIAQTTTRTQETQTRTSPSIEGGNGLSEYDLLLGQIWGLNTEEMLRAKVLLKGPRASFSVPNLSPIEALGIHARNDAERRKYAEMFAKSFHQDVERSLQWDRAFQAAMQQMYPHQAYIDYSGVAKVVAPIGSADAANVPRYIVTDPAPSARPTPKKP